MAGAVCEAAASSKRARPFTAVVAAFAAVLVALPSAASAQLPGSDERTSLAPGYFPSSAAAKGVELLDNDPRVAPFDAAPGDFGFLNTDLAIKGDLAFVGSFNGFQLYDLSDRDDPVLRSSFVCPGGQGDVSVYGDLLFMSVEETRGRVDCGTQGAPGAVNAERFRGVRIFDISDPDHPVQLPGVQTCRGSHTHTLVPDRNDPANLYVYNSGTTGVRSGLELPGCEDAALTASPVTTDDPARWRIEVIRVPLANPERAAIVSRPPIFADRATGAFNGLQNTLPGELHPSGTAYSPLPNTNACHDVTAFPQVGLAAAACQGNGVLLDISDPANPVRVDAVADPNFSYWHSATFSNDGTKVIFTDEWGGGVNARCRATDQLGWAADAIFDIVDRKLQFRSYWKLPVAQSATENCVAHNGNIVPVPGRDILSQAWYQGGHVLVDFSDSAHPKEIAYFDRGPIDVPNESALNMGGFWSTYFFNGRTYGTEIARGLDTFRYTPTPDLSRAEIAAAAEPRVAVLNAQLQSRVVHDPSFAVARSYLDQLLRAGKIGQPRYARIARFLAQAKRLSTRRQRKAARAQLTAAARELRVARYATVRRAIVDLRATL
ncbi:MAG: hypothetical protein ICV64_00890 [Thermoleophilia bacterium]|nr:hypothetical protein [Thermoleophilia bacterium]